MMLFQLCKNLTAVLPYYLKLNQALVHDMEQLRFLYIQLLLEQDQDLQQQDLEHLLFGPLYYSNLY
ncbi:hypothetical protein SDC9_61228 [bioreactor metagenome]|uniref:Uncharacterized protein n=1 Tax=bioreactor metagenome TaxID=1076179 RepID=A0A644XL90_9ZZZZ